MPAWIEGILHLSPRCLHPDSSWPGYGAGCASTLAQDFSALQGMSWCVKPFSSSSEHIYSLCLAQLGDASFPCDAFGAVTLLNPTDPASQLSTGCPCQASEALCHNTSKCMFECFTAQGVQTLLPASATIKSRPSKQKED